MFYVLFYQALKLEGQINFLGTSDQWNTTDKLSLL